MPKSIKSEPIKKNLTKLKTKPFKWESPQLIDFKLEKWAKGHGCGTGGADSV